MSRQATHGSYCVSPPKKPIGCLFCPSGGIARLSCCHCPITQTENVLSDKVLVSDGQPPPNGFIEKPFPWSDHRTIILPLPFGCPCPPCFTAGNTALPAVDSCLFPVLLRSEGLQVLNPAPHGVHPFHVLKMINHAFRSRWIVKVLAFICSAIFLMERPSARSFFACSFCSCP